MPKQSKNKQEEREIKPVAECQTLGEVMATLTHMVKELNQIPGVKASMGVEPSHTESKEDK